MMSHQPILTEADINLLENRFKEVFATKQDLNLLEVRFRETFATKEEMTQFKSDIFDKIDVVLGEVVAMRQELAIPTAHSEGKHSSGN